MTRFLQASVMAALVFAAPALAQQTGLDTGPSGERPWAKGVSASKQRAALDLFRDGNSALKLPDFRTAAAKYREALALWDHPAIHYNLALALLQLDQPVETYEHVLAALKYGRDPLDSDKFDQANRYKSLLEGQLANVSVTCNTDGATVKLDGQVLFVSPGKWQGLVKAGSHTIIGSKQGYVTSEQTTVMPPGQPTSFNLKLFTTDDLTEYRRRFNVAIPWVVVGVGAAIAAGSVALHFGARDLFKQYDTGITGCTKPDTGGCSPSLELSSVRSRAESQQSLAIAGYVVGGVALAAGSWLVYFNRLQAFRVDMGVATLLPYFSPNGAGATVFASF